jgi:hypothetical protein
MVSGFYSVLCVMFFGESDPELFGRWTRALFTLFQVSSGDGWVQTVVRPMIRDNMDSDDTDVRSMLPVLFFMSYYIIISIVLFNIVVSFPSHPLATCQTSQDVWLTSRRRRRLVRRRRRRRRVQGVTDASEGGAAAGGDPA